MSRFYDENLNQINQVPLANGQGLRKVWVTDAIRKGWVSSVTQVCALLSEGEWLEDWKIKQHLDAAQGLGELLQNNHEGWKDVVRKKAEKEMSKAPDIGKDVHKAIEDYFKYKAGGPRPNIPQDVKPYIRAVDNLVGEHSIVPRPEKIEKVVLVAEAPAAGTLDMVGTGFGSVQNIYFDWKTQKVRNNKPNYRFKYWLQTAAYWGGEGKQGYTCLIILDTSKHEEYSKTNLPQVYFQIEKNPDRYYQYFLQLARIYYDMNGFDYEELVKKYAKK